MTIAEEVTLNLFGDDRGSLTVLEQGINVPFEIKRIYYIYDTKQGVRRGFHAHQDLQQLAVCVAGSCSFLLDDGKTKQHVLLDSPTKGLIINSMIWREMYDFSDDCVLLVLASEHYTEDDYIRDYDTFLSMAQS